MCLNYKLVPAYNLVYKMLQLTTVNITCLRYVDTLIGYCARAAAGGGAAGLLPISKVGASMSVAGCVFFFF